MRVVKTTRLASNPHKKRRTARKMTPKQIRHFGTKRQKAALKAASKRKRTMKANSHRTVKRVSHGARRVSNPLVLHLKPIQRSNPKRRATSMTKPKKRKRSMKNTRRRVARVSNRRRRASNPVRPRRRRATNRMANPIRRRRRSNSRRRNTTRVVVMAPRRANCRRGRNPQLFGSSLGSKNSLMILGGGLAGVAATKFIPTMIPTSLTSSLGTSSFGPFIISGLSAVAAWWVAKFVNEPFAEGVLFGGLMQTASVALNAFLPGFTIGGVPIALSGFGDLVAGQFAVPQNPLRAPYGRLNGGAAPTHAMAPTGSKVTTSGLGRAYPSAY
jgi:hypothetical protein